VCRSRSWAATRTISTLGRTTRPNPEGLLRGFRCETS
jgi:hypothetical protein